MASLILKRPFLYRDIIIEMVSAHFGDVFPPLIVSGNKQDQVALERWYIPASTSSKTSDTVLICEGAD